MSRRMGHRIAVPFVLFGGRSLRMSRRMGHFPMSRRTGHFSLSGRTGLFLNARLGDVLRFLTAALGVLLRKAVSQLRNTAEPLLDALGKPHRTGRGFRRLRREAAPVLRPPLLGVGLLQQVERQRLVGDFVFADLFAFIEDRPDIRAAGHQQRQLEGVLAAVGDDTVQAPVERRRWLRRDAGFS